jgi:hypothetical protein
MQAVASAYNKSALSKHPNSLNDPQKTSGIEVIKSGQKVLADGIKSSPKVNTERKNLKEELYDTNHLNSQNIKKAIFGNDSQLLNKIEKTLNINNFSQKASKVNVYVDEMVANIKEVMDIKAPIKESIPNDSYKRFNITV